MMTGNEGGNALQRGEPVKVELGLGQHGTAIVIEQRQQPATMVRRMAEMLQSTIQAQQTGDGIGALA